MTFWQNIVLKWKEIQQFCLWALPSDPSGLKESGMYYNTTANRAALRDDTKTQLLAHLEDTYKNAGVIKQPTITKGTNSITVGNDAIIRCYKTTDYSGIIQEITNPTGGTFAITKNVDQWLIYTYGVGFSIVSSIPTGPLSNVIPVFRYFNAFGVIHSSTQDELGKGAIEKTLVRIAQTEYIRRVGDSGIELSTSGLNVLISGGFAYNASILETIAPFDSATNNLYRVVYDDGVWSQTTLHALTNTHYNPSTGLAALNSNKYCWAYVWRSVGDDIEAFFQLGEQEYATEELAIKDLGKMPANIYGLYTTHCVLVGYVLLKQGVTTTQYFSAWGRPTVAGAPVYHNTLAGIDAGDPGTAYFGHVKLIDNTRLNAAGAANGFALLGADGKLPSGQLPSYVDDALEYATKANFPATGENGKIYVDIATNLTWRWSGSIYVEISPSLALGETSATAYRGDRGKTAYDHSQAYHAPVNADNTQGALNAGASKTTPVDADTLPVLDSAASNAIKKLSWANVKATLKAYFDGLYASTTDYVSKTTETTQSIISAITMRRISASCLLDDLTISEQATERIRIGTRPPSDNSVITVGVERVLNANGHIFTDSSKFSPSIDGLAQASYDSMPATGGTNNIDHMISYQSRIEHQGSGRLNRLYGFGVNHFHHNGPVSNSYGFYCGASYGNVIPDNTYGLYISPLVGSVKYGIYGEGPDTWKNNGAIEALSAKIGGWSPYPGHTWARFGHASKDNIGGYGFLQHESGVCLVGFERGTSFSVQSRLDGVGGDTLFSVDDAGTHVKTPDADDNSDKVANTAWVRSALAGKASAEANCSEWVEITNGSSAIQWLDGFTMRCPKAEGVNNFSNQILEIECSQGPNATIQYYSKVYMHLNAQGTSVTFRAEKDVNFASGEIFARYDSDSSSAYLTIDVKMSPYSTVRIRRVMGDGSNGSTYSTTTDVDASLVNYAFEVYNNAAPNSHSHPSDTSRLAIGSGLSAGASVVVRPYVSGQAHNANTIYLEY